MSKIRLVVCDIDDTLVHKELHLAENTREVIRELKDAGVMFTLATGRMPYRAEVFAREAELAVPYIANNGRLQAGSQQEPTSIKAMMSHWTIRMKCGINRSTRSTLWMMEEQESSGKLQSDYGKWAVNTAFSSISSFPWRLWQKAVPRHRVLRHFWTI